MTNLTPEVLAALERDLAALPAGMHDAQWCGSTASPGHMELGAWVPGWGRCSLMRPRRWGMNGARFQFLDTESVSMVDADRLVKYQVGNPGVTGVQNRDGSVYREDIAAIDHPVARLIVGLLNAAPGLLAAAQERGALRRRLVAAEMLVEDALRHGYDLDPQEVASALAATPGGE